MQKLGLLALPNGPMKIYLLTLMACSLAAQAFADVRPIVIRDPPCPTTVDEWIKRRDDFVNRYALIPSKQSDTVGRWAIEQLEYLQGCRKKSLTLFSN